MIVTSLPPPPSHTSDKDEHDEGHGEDLEEGVHAVAPHAGEDVVQLDVDGGEGEEPGEDQDEGGGPVPHHGGDLALGAVGFTRGFVRGRL